MGKPRRESETEPLFVGKKRTFRIDEAARELEWSVSTVKRALADGILQAKRTPGGHRRVTYESMQPYL